MKHCEDQEKQGRDDEGEAEAGARGGSSWPAWAGGRRRGVAMTPAIPPPGWHFSGGGGDRRREGGA